MPRVELLEPVPVSDTEQWALIRSDDGAHPLLLFIHGGPGTSQLTLMRRNMGPLERHYTVVQWDQRGAGKSYGVGRDGMNIAKFVDDVVSISSHLCARFGQTRVTLVGHSWGSAIGMLAIAQRPDLFAAYVGIGQVARMLEGERLSYAWTLEQAERAGDRAARRLRQMGPPPYEGEFRAKFLAQRKLLAQYGGEVHRSRVGALGMVLTNLLWSREYSWRDRVRYFRGSLESLDALFPELMTLDLFERVPAVDVPVWFALGRHDHEVPSELSARYFEALRAPRKELVWFERSAHMPHLEERERFHRLMIDDVLPVVTERTRPASRHGWAEPFPAPLRPT